MTQNRSSAFISNDEHHLSKMIPEVLDEELAEMHLNDILNETATSNLDASVTTTGSIAQNNLPMRPNTLTSRKNSREKEIPRPNSPNSSNSPTTNAKNGKSYVKF